MINPTSHQTLPITTILLVDDNTLMLQQIKDLIATEPGIEVIGEATDGLEVISKARELKPHLVLMDVRLPGQNGLEATRQLKAEMPQIQVIILTLYDLSIYRDAALANGAGAYVIKKTMRQELLPAIRRVIHAIQGNGTSHLRQVEPLKLADSETTTNRANLQVRVLIVEDKMFNQKIAQKFLERFGCRVVLAGSGREALTLLNQQSFDLVLMDCEMPEMDGFETTAEIRRRHSGSHIPIIALTAGAKPEDQRRCLAAGMDGYLSKPLQLETLAGILARWVPALSSELSPETADASLQIEPLGEADGSLTPAALDPVTLRRLRNLAQATEVSWFTRLLEKFQSDAVAEFTTVRQAVAEDDNSSLNNAIHRLKGASLNIGAFELGDICRQLEDLDGSQAMDARALLARLEHELGRVQSEIVRELGC